MSLQAGIVGLPNVGKSTLFSALTAVPVDRASYPFTTIEPNVGIVAVPDPRLALLRSVFTDREVIPAVVEIVDIAGLIGGASQGEGLGNQFLAQIRNVDAILHVVRCFDDPEIASVTGNIDPVDEIETVRTELILADLQVLAGRRQQAERAARTGAPGAQTEVAALEEVESWLEAGQPVRAGTWTEAASGVIAEAQLLSAKPVLYVCNIGEERHRGEELVAAVSQVAETEGSAWVVLCAQLEAEIAELPVPEQGAFREEAGLEEPGTATLARAAYRLLGLITFFTTPTEVRAWQLPQGGTALQAAARIHTDFAQHFIRVDVYRVEDLAHRGSEGALRAAGLIRTEGRDYVVQDGDVLLFKVGR